MAKKHILITLFAMIELGSNLHAMNQPKRFYQWWDPRDYLAEEAEAIRRAKKREEEFSKSTSTLGASYYSSYGRALPGENKL